MLNGTDDLIAMAVPTLRKSDILKLINFESMTYKIIRREIPVFYLAVNGFDVPILVSL
jgi:hypothetical protein